MHLYASDGTYTDDESFTWNIGGAITITDPGDQTSNEGARADLQIQASDTISGANMTYAITGQPPGVTINSTGLITGNLTGGSWRITVTVSDNNENSATDTFNWVVGSPITISDPATKAAM